MNNAHDPREKEDEVRKSDALPSSQLAPESEGLEPRVGNGLVVRYHPDIHGENAELVDVQPTRGELKTLAYHYLDRYFAVQDYFYLEGSIGSSEARESLFAWSRFLSIASALKPDGPIPEFQEYIDKRWARIKEYESLNASREPAPIAMPIVPSETDPSVEEEYVTPITSFDLADDGANE